MTLHQALQQARHALASQDIDVPRLEAELLLMEALGLSRAQLYACLREELPQGTESALRHLLERRLAGEPLAYIRGHKEFYSLDFLVDHRVLIPRPESEALVEAALAWLAPQGLADCQVADVGTGCGTIAVSLAVNLPRAVVYATDLSVEALEVAEANAQRHGVAHRVHLLHGDLLEPLSQPVLLIVANLPYIATGDWHGLPPEVAGFEPRLALDGGDSGMEPLQRLLAQAPDRLTPRGALLLEIGYGQGAAALELARVAFPRARRRLLPDLAGIPRVLSIDTTEGEG